MDLSKINRIVILILLILAVVYVFLNNKLEQNSDSTHVDTTSGPNLMADEECIPTFADGGGPYYQANSPFREKIVPEGNLGDPLIVEGRILFNDCETPASGAVLDVWQSNESGSYEDEWYRGQVRADDEGNYRFETVIPEGYGSGTGYRPPHIHFKVHLDSRELITSQMFFPEAQGREGFDEAYIMGLEEITNDSGEVKYIGQHNIILPIAKEDL